MGQQVDDDNINDFSPKKLFGVNRPIWTQKWPISYLWTGSKNFCKILHNEWTNSAWNLY